MRAVQNPAGLDLASADTVLLAWDYETEREAEEIREFLLGAEISFQSARVRNGMLEFFGVGDSQNVALPCLIVFQNIHYLSSPAAPHKIFFIQGSRNIRRALNMKEASRFLSDTPYPPLRFSLDSEVDY